MRYSFVISLLWLLLLGCADSTGGNNEANNSGGNNSNGQNSSEFSCIGADDTLSDGSTAGSEIRCDATTEYCARENFRQGLSTTSGFYGCRSLGSCTTCDCVQDAVETEFSTVNNCSAGFFCSQSNNAITLTCNTPDPF